MSDEIKTVLFVDDEPNVLASLRRLLRKEGYGLVFASGGQEALDILETTPVDLVVSDVLMPEMDGVTFLKHVKDRYPGTIRLILTGYASKDFVKQALAEECANEVLAKPWEDEKLKAAIRQSLERSDDQRQEGEWLHSVINSLSSLPTLPQVYLEIKEALADQANLSVDRIARIVEQDPSISLRLLKWANSAVFGQRNPVETVNRAVVVLGMEMVEGLVLTMSVFDALSTEAPEIPDFGREAFWVHSSGCGAIAKMLLEARSADKTIAAQAFIAGLLHDIGKLVEDRYLHDMFAEAVSLALGREGLLHEAEQEIMGATHADIGNHLAEWWNLPSFVANAVRYHHTPKLCDGDLDILGAVHVADVLMDRLEIGASGNFRPPPLNSDIWSRFSVTKEQLAAMRQMVESGMQ